MKPALVLHGVIVASHYSTFCYNINSCGLCCFITVTYYLSSRFSNKPNKMPGATAAIPAVKTKIYYIDNLRVVLTVLVILHHTVITYGGPGGWYYIEPTTSIGALIPMTLFVATNQAFFMGFFFFLSALFTESSYQKKGTAKFLADRLKRLGLPLVFYSFLFAPFLSYLVYTYGYDKKATYWQYLNGYNNWISFGVLWFVAALLVFTVLYVLIQKANGGKPYRPRTLPKDSTIFLFALGLGVVSYLVRIIFPVGWVLKPVGFQLGHFPQYIALFSLGIVASRNNWLAQLNPARGRKWLIWALVLVFLIFPSVFAASKITNSPLETFQGNGTWQSFTSSVWEQLTGISIIMALLCFTKAKWNNSSTFMQRMARSAFATYIVHPLVVISFTLLLKSWQVNPAFKLLAVAPFVVTISFLLGNLLVKLPGVKNVV